VTTEELLRRHFFSYANRARIDAEFQPDESDDFERFRRRVRLWPPSMLAAATEARGAPYSNDNRTFALSSTEVIITGSV
jgi:hypothetical protein